MGVVPVGPLEAYEPRCVSGPRMTTGRRTGNVRDNHRDASDPPIPAIPKLRGWLHTGVAPLVTTGGIVLACLAPAGRARDSVIIYTIAGLLLFTTSAVYHRGTWRPVIDDALRRADHANVYLLIAVSYTPVAVLAPSPRLAPEQAEAGKETSPPGGGTPPCATVQRPDPPPRGPFWPS